MGIIGSLNVGALRYCEAPESGALSDSIAAGVRTRTVTAVYTCLKSESKAILAALPIHPDPLLTAGGRNPNGTLANMVNWGSDFELSGADVSEISPSMSRIAAQYQVTDPTGGDGVAQAGDAAGAIVGKPWEGGNRYCETPASGKAKDGRVYLSDSFGWNRERVVDFAIACLKVDARTVADALSLAPALLTTTGGSGAAVNWGGGYSLLSLYGAPISPSLYSITAKYRRNIAEAIAAPPAGLSLSCLAGVCSIVWNGSTFEAMDSGLGTETTGLDVDNPSGYTIRMLCNGVVFDTFTPTVTSGDKVLAWTIAGNKATLKWCNETWREYDT